MFPPDGASPTASSSFGSALRRAWLSVLLGSVLSSQSVHGQSAVFVRQGIVLQRDGAAVFDSASEPVSSEAVDLDDGRRMLLFDWRPLSKYQVRGPGWHTEMRAPLLPTPYVVRRLRLEDARAAAAAGAAPDTIVSFRPDNRHLAVGTFFGRLLIVDCYTGRIVHERRVAEGMIKQLAWSPSGDQLYVGEQSPDADLVALRFEPARDPRRPARVARVWSARLADDLETSRPPAEDRFGIYTWPGVFDLHVADDGRVFAAGMHSWPVSGRWVRRSAVYCFNADGSLDWRFPAEHTTSLGIAHMATDRAGTAVLFLTTAPPDASEASGRDRPDDELRAGCLLLVDGSTGAIAAQYTVEPLAPHFNRVEAWDSVAVAADGSRAALGLVDGRALLFDSSAGALELLKEFDLGTPSLIGRVPLVAACSYTRIFNERLFLQTQNTHIAFANPQAANATPAPHRGANTLTVTDLEGRPQWRYRGPFSLGGSWTGQGRGARWLVVTCRELPGTGEAGQFGFLLFDMNHPGSGSQKLVYYYPTAGPVMFDADISHDGRLIAVTETPALTADRQDVYGTYQVHIVH